MKMWSGRFDGQTDKAADDFNSSLRFDIRLFSCDIAGSIAHVQMLSQTGIIPADEAAASIEALKKLKAEVESGSYEIKDGYEDIHMAIEEILTERIGDAAKRIHTARSRNDQVATDMKLYVKGEVIRLIGALEETIAALSAIAKENTETLMPGYTHMQKAQPITYAHYLCAYIEMFKRDHSRLTDCFARMDTCPLGSGALAASTFPIDRELTAKLLGFAAPCENSLDGVADRDYLIELMSDLSMIMLHMSRMCEEIIIWSSEEFSYITLSDAFSTGSSMMPQKKNPDMAELIRGKTGRVYGNLISLLVTMKALPLAYNKDMQEDKESFFDALDTVFACLDVFNKMVSSITLNKERMENACVNSFLNATDMAEYLVKRGCAFRDAHFIVGALVKHCIERGIYLSELSLEELKAADSRFEADIFTVLDPHCSIQAKSALGSPNPKNVNDYLNRQQ